MKTVKSNWTLLAVGTCLAFASISLAHAKSAIGGVYSASNKAGNNSVFAFKQFDDGTLEAIGEYNTGGKGTGNIEIFDNGFDQTHPLADGVDPLISAYGLFHTDDNKHVLVVNSGDGTVSSLKVEADYTLTLVDTVKASDIHPLSIASRGDLVYVASAGDAKAPPFSGSISGYKIDSDGKLNPIADSTRNLGARPTTIVFSTDASKLVVNELVTGKFKVFAVNGKGGISKSPVSMAGAPNGDADRWLPIPVGFDVIKGKSGDVILASEARFLDKTGSLREEANAVPQSPKYSWQTGSSSSYTLAKDGTLSLVSGDVMTGGATEGGEIANCWVETSADGNVLWAANALSSSISSYDIADDGSISLSNAKAFKVADESEFFSDLILSSDGKYLNQLVGNQGAVRVFEIAHDGHVLTPVGKYSGLPEVGAYGVISLSHR